MRQGRKLSFILPGNRYTITDRADGGRGVGQHSFMAVTVMM